MSPRRRSTRTYTKEEVYHNRVERTIRIASNLQEELTAFNRKWQQDMKALKAMWKGEGTTDDE